MRRFRGPLVTVNVQTGDGRVIADDAISFAPLPLPFAWIRDGDQHINLTEVAPQVGIIDAVERVGDDWIGEGAIDDENPDGAELVRRMEAGTASFGNRQLVSIDPDDWAVEIISMAGEEGGEGVLLLASAGRGVVPRYQVAAAGEPDPGSEGTTLLFEDASDLILERYTRMRVRGATGCAVSAFTSAWIELVDDPADALEPEGDDGEVDEVVAAAGRTRSMVRPPRAAFHLPEPQPGDIDDGSVYGMPVQELLVEQPDGGLAVPFTIVERDGLRWCFGHAARWGQCHVGYPGQCITAPESLSGYAHFHHGNVLCDDGLTVATGPLTMNTDHAGAELLAPEARDHYAHTGLAFADVRASNGSLGVWTSGIVRPSITDEQLHVIRASSLSGDWRRIDDALDFIGTLAVNIPGFPIARELTAAAGITLPMASLAASAFMQDGVQQSLVAAGIVQRCPECAQRAMTHRDEPTPEVGGEALELLRTIELRTRHLAPAAAEHALRHLRREAVEEPAGWTGKIRRPRT